MKRTKPKPRIKVLEWHWYNPMVYFYLIVVIPIWCFIDAMKEFILAVFEVYKTALTKWDWS